jgi:tetraacyldisaccharide 4'-kinase
MDFPADRALQPSWLTIPVSYLYGALARSHHRRYDKNLRRIERASVPVISVGNLTVGGTGKTPCVASLIPLLQDVLTQREISGTPAILTRGYGRQAKSTMCLRTDSPASLDWREVGDEPMMLHRLLPNVPIVVNKDRVRSAAVAVRDCLASVLLLDDGFEYRALHKNLEIVLLDSQKPLGNGYLLPAGPLREAEDALQRADVLVGVGAAQEEKSPAARLAERFGKPFFEAFVRPGNPHALTSAKTETCPKGVVLLSGIARPHRFRLSATESGFDVLEHFSFRDHHAFCQREIIHIEKGARKLGAEAILTTAKDAVRLSGLSFKLPIWILPVEFVWKNPEEITRVLTRVFVAHSEEGRQEII